MTGAFTENLRILVNEADQGMFLRDRDAARPGVLFLHGGPGMPEFFLGRTHPTGLENDFVVCLWEQRGSGSSSARPLAPGARR